MSSRSTMKPLMKKVTRRCRRTNAKTIGEIKKLVTEYRKESVVAQQSRRPS